MVDNYYHEEGEKALQSARERLDEAGIAHSSHIEIGHVAETIAKFVKDKRCDQIVMGTRGPWGSCRLIAWLGRDQGAAKDDKNERA
jgi:nucleotide-binding universal stress UspA family protein